MGYDIDQINQNYGIDIVGTQDVNQGAYNDVVGFINFDNSGITGYKGRIEYNLTSKIMYLFVLMGHIVLAFMRAMSLSAEKLLETVCRSDLVELEV